MPTKVIKKFTAWSYSRYKDYVKCPLYAKLKHVDKLPEPGSAALTRGSDIHTLAERYVRGDIKKLPQELSAFKEEFKDLRNVGRDSMMLEDQRAFDINWRPVEWYSPLAWVRVIYDVHYLKDGFRYVVDHKTGRVRDENLEQLDLYGATAASIPSDLPEINITASLWYLDEGEERTRSYDRPQAELLKEEWTRKVQPMMNDTKFKPKPGNACRWCHFAKGKGGPCPY